MCLYIILKIRVTSPHKLTMVIVERAYCFSELDKIVSFKICH